MVLRIKVSSKGQVVIPISVRTRLNIGTGTELEVREGPDYISLHPLPDDPVLASRGLLRREDESHSLVRELLQAKRATDSRRRSTPEVPGEAQTGAASAQSKPVPTLFDPVTR